MKQQTAVEWMAIRYHHRQGHLTLEDIAKAKEMEKDQIMNSWAAGEYPDAESYYREIYEHPDPTDDEIYNNFNHEGGIKFTKEEWQGR